MSISARRASRALWARRLRFRQGRLEHWKRKNDAGKVKRWKALVAQAAANVKRRDAQIAEASRVRGVSSEGVALIARFEGFVDHVYRDSVGVETIGYGETRRDIINRYRSSRISEPAARKLLKQRLDADYAPPVLALRPPTQNATDALVSLVYNTGPGSIARGTTIGDALRRRDWHAAADGFLLWNKGGGRVLPGLVSRRQAERALFLRGL